MLRFFPRPGSGSFLALGEGKAHGLKLLDDLFERLAAEVSDLHHILFGCAGEILNRIDAGSL